MNSSSIHEFYTPKELAKITRTGLDTIYIKLKNKEVPSIRLGKKWLIPKSFLDVPTKKPTLKNI